MGVWLEARDVLGDDDWKSLRREAMEDLLNEKGYRHPGVVSDIVDARAALESNRKAEALFLIDRVLAGFKQYAEGA